MLKSACPSSKGRGRKEDGKRRAAPPFPFTNVGIIPTGHPLVNPYLPMKPVF